MLPLDFAEGQLIKFEAGGKESMRKEECQRKERSEKIKKSGAEESGKEVEREVNVIVEENGERERIQIVVETKLKREEQTFKVREN